MTVAQEIAAARSATTIGRSDNINEAERNTDNDIGDAKWIDVYGHEIRRRSLMATTSPPLLSPRRLIMEQPRRSKPTAVATAAITGISFIDRIKNFICVCALRYI